MAEDELAIRRKRLKYRSARRGTRELDLFLGAFAGAHLDALSPGQLDRYEAILNANENDIFDWLSGRVAIPPEHDNEIMKLILNFKFSPVTN
jgi:antitoxin CptB